MRLIRLTAKWFIYSFLKNTPLLSVRICTHILPTQQNKQRHKPLRPPCVNGSPSASTWTMCFAPPKRTCVLPILPPKHGVYCNSDRLLLPPHRFYPTQRRRRHRHSCGGDGLQRCCWRVTISHSACARFSKRVQNGCHTAHRFRLHRCTLLSTLLSTLHPRPPLS